MSLEPLTPAAGVGNDNDQDWGWGSRFAIRDSRFAVRVALAFFALLMVGCSGPADVENVGEHSEALTAAKPVPSTLTIALPGNLAPQATPLAATKSLRIADRASILKKSSGYATVVNTGDGPTRLGVDARSGSIWSGGKVTLAPRAMVDGFVKSAKGLQREPGSVVTGTTDAAATLSPLRQSTWQVSFPPNTGGRVDLQPNGQRQLSPGGYASVNAKAGATLTLSSGTYGFDSLMLEPTAKVVIDDRAGPVVVYVRGGFTFRGQVQKQGDLESTKPQFLVVAFCGAFIEAPFKGTVVTPTSSLVLQPLNGRGAHYGAFFGQDVSVEPGVVIHHQAFPWSTLLPPTETVMTDAPVILKPSLTGDISKNEPGANVTEVTSDVPVDFAIPRDIWVSSGNAGRGSLRFSFRLGSGSTTVCAYRGGSSVETPTSDLDVAKGRRYLLVSCTDGHIAGQSASANWFSLEVVSSAPNFKETAVDLQFGRGCSGSLAPPLTPEEVVVLRDNYDWRTVNALPEMDPDGTPALWHGMIYIDRKEQLQALDRWRVYWSAIPFSSGYMDGMVGKCGRVEHATDGKGVVVYAIFPAKLFNILRTFSIEAVLKNAAPPFKFVVPSTPDEAGFTNSDGSVKYSALASSGYHKWLATRAEQLPWFGSSFISAVTKPFAHAANWIDDHIIDAATDVVEAKFSYVGSAWDSFVDWTANALDNTWETVQVGLGNLIEVVGGDSIKVTLDVDIVSRDRFIKGPIVRGWGPNDPGGRRPKLVPNGIFVSIRQWGWGIVPVLNQARLPADGHVVIEALEDGEGRNGKGLCFELENDDALMTSDWIPNEVCDFDGPVYDDFEHDTTNHLVTNQKDLHALTQFTDGANYMRTVVGFEPKQMAVLIGWAATNMTKLVNSPREAIAADEKGDSRAMTLCLDFPGVGSASITQIGTFLGGYVGMTAASLWQKDLWWPDDNDPSTDSRGVATHEYGHFAMCSLLFEKAAGEFGLGGPAALTGLMARVTEGANGEQRSNKAGVITESWADAFTMQVAGGANYVKAENATKSSNDPKFDGYAMGFCTEPNCMEFNYRGIGDYAPGSAGSAQYNDEIAKVLSTIHDAFDSSDSSRRLTAAPSNGDVWAWDASQTQLVFSPTGYLAVADEPAGLSGVGWQTWVEKWLARGGAVDYDAYLGALSDAMDAQGNSWCSRCEVFAIHEAASGNGIPQTYVTSNFSTLHGRWSSCLTGQVAGYVGAPPEAYLNVDSSCQACPLHSFADGGICTPCAADQVARGTSCLTCLDGTIPDSASNECVGCAATEVSINGACAPCGVGRFADHTVNACVICPADALVDVSSLLTCGPVTVDTMPSSVVNDPCPSEFWLEVSHLEAAGPKGCDYLTLSATPKITTGAQCRGRDVTMSVFDSSLTSLFSGSSSGVWHEGTSTSGDLALDLSYCSYSLEHTLPGADLAGLGSVRVLAEAREDFFGFRRPSPATITVQVGDDPPR